MKIRTQVCIIGAGAGGTGCAYRLIKNGIKTVIVDRNPDFGGTAVFCGVDGWEPGVSLNGMHLLLKKEMDRIKNGCHVVETVPNCNLFNLSNGSNWENHSFEKYPWGLSMPTGCDYEDTLKRCTFLRGNGSMKRLQFEPSAMIKAIHNVMEPFKDNMTTFFGYSYKTAITEHKKIESVFISNGEQEVEIFADYFVDATGNIVFARDIRCECVFGSEGKEEYGEPSAEEKSDTINAVTYVFRVAKTSDPTHIDKISMEYQDVDIHKWLLEDMKRTVSCFTQYPNGDLNINMLPTMQGNEYFALKDKADKVGFARVYAYWNYLQKEKNMQGYTLLHIYDAGIRESYRLKGKYVLKEQDVREGILKQPKIGRTVAIADHALDIHGNSGMCKELTYPYEIPIECTMPKEYENLFVACRGASFSHIAASTVRLTRTMLSLGEGVGEYITEIINKT